MFNGCARCTPCNGLYFREWREKNLEHRKEYENGRYARDPHVSARRLIQTAVSKGRIPAARDLHCVDCGGSAEEYDHYMGYEGINRRMVQPVCRPCHVARELGRNGLRQQAA